MAQLFRTEFERFAHQQAQQAQQATAACGAQAEAAQHIEWYKTQREAKEFGVRLCHRCALAA